MKCISCSYQNQEGAKFCRSCGAKLELSTIVKQVTSLVKCISCGYNNIAYAKFCAKCGKKMTGGASPIPVESSTNQTPVAPKSTTPSNPPKTSILHPAPGKPEPAAVRTVAAAHQERIAQSDIPALPQKVAPSRKGIYAFVAIAVALTAIGGGSYFVIQDREQKRLALEQMKLELEKKTRTDREEKQRALAIAEAARRKAEEQAAKLLQQQQEAAAKEKELEVQQRDAELKRRGAERRTADAKRREIEARGMEREAEAKRMELEAKMREAAAARARQKPAASAPSPAPRTAPQANTPQRVTVEQACASRGNVITRGFCQVTECMKSANYSDLFCAQARETADRNR